MIKKKELREKILSLVEQYGSIDELSGIFQEEITPIQATGKVIDGVEMKLMTDAVLDGWLTTGRYNDEFEQKLANYLGAKFAITTNSGSSANLLAFTALTSPKLGERQVKSGDEVITVAAAFPTTVNPILQNNCVPVFVDIEIPTYNIDVTLLEQAYSKKTKAVMVAHTLGNPYNLAAVKKFVKKYNLWLIEDCCDALGSEYSGKKVSTFGDISTISFYPAHHITMGEGGAVITSNIKLKKIIESYRDWGRDCYCPPGCDNTCNKRFSRKLGELPKGYDHKYIYSHVGYNLKITDIQAACGVAQLSKLSEFTKKRKENFYYLTNRLKRLTEYIILPEATPGSDPSWFSYPITIKNPKYNRRDLVEYLDSFKIGTRLLFSGNIIKQPYFKGENYRVVNSLKNTDRAMSHTFCIGVYPGITNEMIDFMADRLEKYFGVK